MEIFVLPSSLRFGMKFIKISTEFVASHINIVILLGLTEKQMYNNHIAYCHATSIID
jgi:hypothetical protein